ncbi:MAG: RNA methyltransferase [Bacteroidales bacterium]|nr:RNA methyltransferase [Bacteroidales bacterium]
MISNAKLKYLASFKQAKNRSESDVFVVEGDKIATEALLSGIEIQALCATAEWLGSNLKTVSGRVPDQMLFEVSDEELSRISLQKSPNKVWLLAKRPKAAADYTATEGLALALDHLQDPGNMGTILRIADWCGIRHVACTPDTVDYLNPKVVQASMGSVFRTQVLYCDLERYIAQSKAHGKTVYGAALGGTNVFETLLVQNAVLVIGNESKGLSPQLLKAVDQLIAIPNWGGTCESLNASVATGIFCAEFRRQILQQ